MGRIRVAVEKGLEQSDQLGRRAVVELNDPELGRMRLDVSHDSGRIKLDVWVEQDTSRQLLKDNRHILEQELERQKLYLEQFSVGGEASGGGERSGFGRGRRKSRGSARTIGEPARTSVSSTHEGQLDVIA